MSSSTTPICPGCHFGCALDDYQCGRGGKFYEKWQAGGEIPERRMPPVRGEDDKGKESADASGDKPRKHTPPAHFAKLPVGSRLMLLMSMAERMIHDRNDKVRDKRIAEYILRQGGSATNRIIAERTHLDDAAIDEQIALLEEAELVTSRTLADGRVFHDLTEAGDARAKQWLEEHRASDTEFYSALTDDEADQLEALLAKALEPHMRRGPKR